LTSVTARDRPKRWLSAAPAGALALVACAWFALGIRQAIAQSRAEAIIAADPHATAAQARRAQQLLSVAAALNPDRQIDLDRVQILLERNQLRAARRTALAVTRAEPQNIEAWVWLAHTAAGDPALFAAALKQVAALEPLRP
jgi:hypothetical protein